MQRQLARQQLYETLSWKSENELTDADKFFLKKMKEPFKFGISYVYSALAGLGISLVTTLGVACSEINKWLKYQHIS